jgi:hypothetical protein
MAKQRYTAEEIVTVLRQVEVAIANSKATPQACREPESLSRPIIGGTRSTAGSSSSRPLFFDHP